MRYLLFVAALLIVTPSYAQSVQVGPGGVRVDDGYRERPRRRQVDCGSLRQACMMKDQLGERGEGNCRTYRQYCRGR